MHVNLTGCGSDISSATITMYHPMTLEEQTVTETWAGLITTNDDETDIWSVSIYWIGARAWANMKY